MKYLGVTLCTSAALAIALNWKAAVNTTLIAVSTALILAAASWMFEYMRLRRGKIISPPGGWFAAVLRFTYGRRTYDRVFRESLTDMLIEYSEALSLGQKHNAAWIVTRWRMVILQVIVEHFWESTAGKLLRAAK